MKKFCNIFSGTCFFATVLIAMAALPSSVFAQDDSDSNNATDTPKPHRFNIHFQATYIYQYQPAFNAKYSGQNSLRPAEDKENSVTGTLYLGARLWKGAEVYINPEIAGGSGLSGAFGLAASTNGETFRVGDPAPTLYLARGVFVQTIQLGKKGNSLVPEGVTNNEVGGMKPNNYVKFYLGKMSLGDLFDNNVYAKDPRSQFINWCLMSNGAYDYAANLRGYTYSFATVLQQGSMSYKAALATLPVVANGADLNTDLGQEYSINAEAGRAYSIGGRQGNARLLGYYNNAHMGNYKQAMLHPDSNGIPDVISTRKYGRTKTGIGFSVDQQISDLVGVFIRAGWNDGQNETWAFTEADAVVSGGVALNGAKWKRKDDNLALAVNVNGLSSDHRDYLASGGLGFQLGDGRLSYANETVVELYYSYKPTSNGIWLTADYQLVLNPGYNSDRGPVNVFSFRLHVEL